MIYIIQCEASLPGQQQFLSLKRMYYLDQFILSCCPLPLCRLLRLFSNLLLLSITLPFVYLFSISYEDPQFHPPIMSHLTFFFFLTYTNTLARPDHLRCER